MIRGQRIEIFLKFVTLVLLAMLWQTSSANADEKGSPPTTYVAVGASETAGFRVPAGDGYPEIIASACSIKSLVKRTTFARPALLADWPSLPDQNSIISLFINPNDAMMFDSSVSPADVQRAIEALKAVRFPIIILGPSLREIPATQHAPKVSIDSQKKLYSLIRRLSKEAKISVVSLTTSRSEIQDDGLHPTIEGQRKIANAVLAGPLHDLCSLP